MGLYPTGVVPEGLRDFVREDSPWEDPYGHRAESAAEVALHELSGGFAQELLELVGRYVWHYGDGRGGYLLEVVQQSILEAAEDLGFDVKNPMKSDGSSSARSARPKRRQFTMNERLAIFKADGYACVECGTDENLQVDHIVALANGGGDERENLRTLCQSCNSRKGAR